MIFKSNTGNVEFLYLNPESLAYGLFLKADKLKWFILKDVVALFVWLLSIDESSIDSFSESEINENLSFGERISLSF